MNIFKKLRNRSIKEIITISLIYLIGREKKNSDRFYAYFYEFALIKSYIKNLNIFSVYIKIKLNKLITNKFYNYNSKKKIILVTHSLSRGGAERQVVKLANLLIKKKFNIQILLTNYDFKHTKNNSYINDLNKKIKINYIPKQENSIEYLKLSTFENKSNLNFLGAQDLYFVEAITKFLKFNKPYIVHSFLDGSNIVVGLAGLIAGVPKIILSLRNAAPWRWTFYISYWKETYKFLQKFKNIKLVCNSSNNARDYEKWLRIDNGSIKLTNNIFEFSKKIEKKKIFKKKIVFGTIARLAPEKRLFFMIKTFKLINNKNYKLKIVGTGYLNMRLKKYSRKLGLENNVQFLGEIKNVENFLKKIDIFILTSYMEGVPNVLLEAQNSKIPIFSTNVGGVEESVIKNKSCYFISSENSVKSSNKIKKLINKKNFFSGNEINLRKSKLKKFLPENVFKQMKKLYN